MKEQPLSGSRAAVSLQALAERYDNDVFVPEHGIARVRLRVRGGTARDAVDGGALRLQPAIDGEPDATLTADAQTWAALAEDARGGLDAYRAGRLSVRQNLHLGIGFLAATSGQTGPGRLRFRMVGTRHGRLSTVEAGRGGRWWSRCTVSAATKCSFLPTGSPTEPSLSGDRAGSARVRRFGQADGGVL